MANCQLSQMVSVDEWQMAGGRVCRVWNIAGNRIVFFLNEVAEMEAHCSGGESIKCPVRHCRAFWLPTQVGLEIPACRKVLVSLYSFNVSSHFDNRMALFLRQPLARDWPRFADRY
jgi:hypothetical protein